MKSMHLLLDEAEGVWREEVRQDFPLRSDTLVVKDDKKHLGEDWHFSTDLKKIFAIISNDESLQRKFEAVAKEWGGEAEEVARETFHYLLFHELYHPIEAPFSVEGKDNDNKKIHQAIRKGLLKAEPKLPPLEQIAKVMACQNGVKDFILDNRLYLDNQQQKYFQADIIPTFDYVELQEAPGKTNFYTITRFLYGILYGPENARNFFEEKTCKKGVEAGEQALTSLLGKTVHFPHQKKSLVEKVQEHVQEHVQDIRAVFTGEDRYAGIERLMSVLGPYVKKDMPQGKHDQQGAEAGASPQNILQDLLDDMPPAEQAQFINSLPKGGKNGELSSGEEDSVKNWNVSKDELNTLDVFASHEFYKRNHPQVKIVGNHKIGENVVVGKREYWNLLKSRVLTEDELKKLNLSHIARFQQKTRLPMLIPLDNGLYQLNEYVLKTREIKDIKYVDAKLDVPEMIEFYLDSSGSMYAGGSQNGFNDGSRWDMLSNVTYGFMDALLQGSQQVKKPCSVRIHNVAESQLSSELIPIEQFWKGDAKLLRVLFKPGNGYGVEDLNISEYKDNKKRAYVIVTDGALCIAGRTEREAQKMKHLAKHPSNDVILFEIGGTYSLGNAVKNTPNIHYHPVHDKNKMLQQGLEVLLAK